ncbi:hypothetical protein Nepgr_013811 [Nepenthes gracilis]|uniref:Uncharacterized protein n=1 Tax=Nepenthes gracilis TaxID=150966 RepID=A0AAD3XPS1_NEPGR|nr:hypothetical protein Nepgr_013811 [Nepenthes gracilis]
MIARSMCLASTINTEQLRSQLDQLRNEAAKTRTKANNARLRLVRLSEAAEQLWQQAATCARVGNETGARELLFQKKKIMLAMEKSKRRAEVLDELAAKLNEAISAKETLLIGKVASDHELDGDNNGSPVWIVSPKHDVAEKMDDDADFHINNMSAGWNQGSQADSDCKTNGNIMNAAENLTILDSISCWNDTELLSSLKGISSYIEFLEHLDRQLHKIEEELATILRLSNLMLDNDEKPNNPKVQQAVEIYENLRGIRGRIKNFMQKEVETE